MNEEFNKTEGSSNDKEEVVSTEANHIIETAPESVIENSEEETEILEDPKIDEPISDSSNNSSEEECELTVGEEQVRFGTNSDKQRADTLDSLISESQKAYINTTDKIINASIKQLNRQFHTKNKMKISFTNFFMWFISIQYVFMVFIFIGKAFCAPDFPNNIILAYIGSVFVETLGALIIMIRHAFDSKQEVNILDILNEAISKYQK